jgi:thiamine-phosphate diphosphorylase
VCLVTDRRRLAPDARTPDAEVAALERFLDDALDAGVDAIQIRERDLSPRIVMALTMRVMARAAGRASILVNDRLDVALAAGASGVHLRGDSVPTTEARRIAPPGWIVGRSVHSPEEAGGEIDATYVLFGPVFETVSKPGAPGAGIVRLEEAVAACHSPVVAIGGMTPERAAQARRAGAAGIAAIGMFLPPGREPSAVGVAPAVRALKTAMQPG